MKILLIGSELQNKFFLRQSEIFPDIYGLYVLRIIGELHLDCAEYLVSRRLALFNRR